ncbi:MAG TPA: nucleoside-triphosphatase [Bacteroidales bacterium]|nr:nucleoside-triphosphatase [Bacteroidales bacterium]
MSKNHEIWLKAAVVGSLWGASEIVLGTFLHNLRIPFSSNLLTAIGIILMIAGSRLWPDKGLIWRAGLICAALKTLSPSHAIFGPMIAITMQAMLMQAAVSFGGRSIPAYIIGGGLAMTWNLTHRVLSAIVVYGASLIDMYQSLVNLLERNTGLILGGYWDPIIVLASIFFAGGAMAAIIGIQISRNIKLQGSTFWRFPEQATAKPKVQSSRPRRFISLIRPVLILGIIVAVMLLISRLPLVWAGPIVLLILFVAFAFDRSIFYGVLCKPGFWIGLSVMILLSGFLLGKNGSGIFNLDGLSIGAGMGLRALVVIAGFKLLSRELRSPDLAAWFKVRKLEGFLLATRVSFQTTPLLLESIPANDAWKNPVKVLKQLVTGMDQALKFMKSLTASDKVILLTGQKGKGKTTLSLKLAAVLKEMGFTVDGIVAPEIVENGERTGYMIQSVITGQTMPLARKVNSSSGFQTIPFVFEEAALNFGKSILEVPRVESADLVILDEAGPLELNGEGWASTFTNVIARRNKPTLVIVRPSLVEKFIEKWNLGNPLVIDIAQDSEEEVFSKVAEKLKE